MLGYDQLSASDGTGEAVLANIDADRAIASITIEVDSVENFPNEFIFCTGDKNANNFIVPSSMTIGYGHVDSGNVIIDGFAPGYVDDGNTAGQILIIKPTTYWVDEVVRLARVAHNDDGSLKDDAVNTDVVEDEAITPQKWTNPYCFMATKASDQAVNDATWTKVNMTTEGFDPNGNYDAATSTYTVPVTGIYEFTGGGYVIDTNGGNAVAWLMFGISVNNADPTNAAYMAQYRVVGGFAGDRAAATGACLLQLTAGQTVTLKVYANTTDSGDATVQASAMAWGGHLVHQIV